MSNGCSAHREPPAAPFIVTEIDAATGAMFARNPWNTRSARASRSRIWPADKHTGRPTGASFSGAMARSTTGGTRWSGPLPSESAPASIRAARCRASSISSRGDTAEVVFFLGEAASAERRKRCSSAIARLDLEAVLRTVVRALGRGARTGPGENAGPFHGHHSQSLDALSDPRLPHVGALGVLSGERRIWLSRPAPGCHGTCGFQARS